MRNHLFNTEKIKYVRGEKPDVECILCSMRDKDEKVKSLEVYRTESFMICVNLYPFNPGHLMIFPLRHVTELTELTDTEALQMHKLLAESITHIKEEFSPSGFNIGYNIGSGSGASISHIHQHIVPRYENEVGFIDVLSGTRIVVVDPVEVKERLTARFTS